MKNIILEIIIAVFVILCDAPDVVTYKNPVLLTSHGYGRNPKILETMLTAGENIDARDKNGWTAMMHAAIRNDFEILEILHDADVNACDNEGRTALILANYDIPNPEVIKYLIRLGADVNARDNNGRTALMECARTYRRNKDINDAVQILTEVREILIQAGADEKARDNKGYTAYMSTPDENNEFVPSSTDLLW